MPSPSRRQLLLLALSSAWLAQPARARAGYPAKPIRLVVPFTPGGVVDVAARVVADEMSRGLGQQVIVDNRPGASGNIGANAVARAEPDGYTLLMGFDGTLVISPHVFESVPFSTLHDFAPIGKVGDSALVLVAHPSLGLRSVSDMVAASKKSAGLAYGTSGIGSTPHIAGEAIRQRTGAKLMHVPYRGGSAALADVLGNSIPLVFTAVASAFPYIKTGKLVALAVGGARREPSLPDVPTMIQSGLADFDFSSWVGLLAPAKTPPAIIASLNAELARTLATATVQRKLVELGIAPTPGTPQQFAELIRSDFARYQEIVKTVGVRMQ